MVKPSVFLILSLGIFAAFLLACGGSAASPVSPAATAAPSAATVPSPAPTAVPTPVPTLVPTPSPTPIPAPLMVSVDELVQAYDGNEVAAQLKYDDQVVLITGKLHSVQVSWNRSQYDVRLRNNPTTIEEITTTSVVCKVDNSQADTVIALEEGQEVTVLGRIAGMNIIDIVVKDCSVQKIVQSTAPAIAPPEPTVAPTIIMAVPTVTATTLVTPVLLPTPTAIPTPTLVPTPTLIPTPAPTPTPRPTPIPAGEIP